LHDQHIVAVMAEVIAPFLMKQTDQPHRYEK